MSASLGKQATQDVHTQPIGLFDSGYGGLTVLSEVISKMPNEQTVFIGDSLYFPYGPKPCAQVRSRVMSICKYLLDFGCKLIVVACNTATAAGLKDAQRAFGVPIIGVVEPGSRAAVYATHTRRVGVIATEGTVRSGAYVDAIHNLDAGIEVVQTPVPQLVDIAERGIQLDGHTCTQNNASSSQNSADEAFADAYEDVARTLLPMRSAGIDTLVLGCTHFPLVSDIIQNCIGQDVSLVSSATETALEVRDMLKRRGALCDSATSDVKRVFLTTSEDVEGFKTYATRILGNNAENSTYSFSHVDV